MRTAHQTTVLLNTGLVGGLPTEFRLFVRGWNTTENGKFLFDDVAAESVMEAYRQWGVDLAIDLEHQMLAGSGADPTARDARGWCKLALRNGELWAVDVRWTPDGAERLAQKRQRYVSPAFEIDPETKRVSKILNVAITAMPATHKTPALVAASVLRCSMDPDLVKQALDAVEKGDTKAAMEILKGLIVSAAGAEPDADDEAGGEGDGAEGVPETESVEDPKVVDASAEPPAKGDDADDGTDDEDEGDDKPAKKAAYKAARAVLAKLTNTSSLAEQLSRIVDWKASHDTLAAEQAKLSKQRAALESDERRDLCAQLVKLGAEFPATVWADVKARKPKARWSNMPIAELRAHVAEQRAARGGAKPARIEPARETASVAGATVEGVQLTPQQLAICAQTGCDPKEYARLLAYRDGKKVGV